MKVTLKGTPNLGCPKERQENFELYHGEHVIQILDADGNVVLSFNPFMDGGSVWLSDFSSIIMDREHWGEDKDGKYKMLWKEEQAVAGVSTAQIIQWKQDSEDLATIREAQKLITGVEQ